MQYSDIVSPEEQVIPNRQNLFKIVVLFSLMSIAFTAGHFGALTLEQYFTDQSWLTICLKWTWLLSCGCVASIAAQGLGVLAHDAVHKVMFSQQWCNELVGGIISAFALIPFNANRQFHLNHHRLSHQRKLDPERPMHDYPLWIAFSIGAIIAIALQYRLVLVNLITRFSQWRYLSRVIKDTLYVSLAFTTYYILIPLAGLSFEHTILPMLLTLPLLFGMRSLSDHYGLPAVEKNKKGSQQISGWVIRTTPLLEWLWSNVNYHEVHHKFPYLSHHNLKATFYATKDQIPYVVVNGYLRNLYRHRQRDYYNAVLPESD